MRKPETVDQLDTAVQRLELQPPSLFQAGQHAPNITVENCTASLIGVLADIILATCLSNEQPESPLNQHQDNQSLY